MIKFLLVLALILGSIISTATTASAQGSAIHCGTAAPLAGVDEPQRLLIYRDCVRASGYVTYTQRFPDGDIHIELLPDPGSKYLLNSGDDCFPFGPGGSCVNNVPELVVEIVPVDYRTCPVCVPNLPVPSVGSHVVMWGPWVLDTVHGWNEIHPLKSWYLR